MFQWFDGEFERHFAQLIGVLGYVVGCWAFMDRHGRGFRNKLTLFSIVMMFHFILLGALTSAAVVALGAMRTFASTKTKSTSVMLLFVIAIISVGLITLSSQAELMTIIGTSIATVALFKLEGIALRICILFNSLCWLVNNYYLQSVGGVAIELTFVIINLYTIYKLSSQPSQKLSAI